MFDKEVATPSSSVMIDYQEDDKLSDIISLKVSELLKLNNNLKLLRKEIIKGVKSELDEITVMCQEAKKAIGEFNGISKRNN